MEEATPTQRITAAINYFLNAYFQEKGDIISGDGPELPVFTPSEDALLAPLWKASVPRTIVDEESMAPGFLQTEYPIVLLNELKAMGEIEEVEDLNKVLSQPGAYKHIDSQKNRCPTFLYGTSGAGKTRTVYEFLSRSKGFYFLGGVDVTSNPGSGDLGSVIDGADLGTISKIGTDQARLVNQVNQKKITQRLSVAILVRYAVHEKLEQEVLQRAMTAYEWLLYQLFPKEFLGGEDLFLEALDYILSNHQAQLMTMKHLHPNQPRLKNTTWPVFVDEAQDLISHSQRSLLNHFQSSKGDIRRSAFSAIMDGFSRLSDPGRPGPQLYFPVFSGTGLEFTQFTEEARSIVAKRLEIRNVTTSDIVFGDFQVLTSDDTKKYLKKFLNLSNVSESVIFHISEWLRGRPRWVASFIEVYVSRRRKSNFHLAGIKDESLDLTMMEALDRYLKVMTKDDNQDKNKRRSWSAGEKSAYALFRKTVRFGNNDDDDEQVGPKVFNDLKQAIGKFAVGKKSHVFTGDKAQFLIEKGVSTVKGIAANGLITGSFDEPIVNEAGMNYFGLDEYLKTNLLNQEDGGLGQAFEKLLLMGMMTSKNDFFNFLESHLKADAQGLKSFLPPTKSAYGVLCFETGTDIRKTLTWIEKSMKATFEGQVPPFCLPNTSIGPDVMYLLRNASYTDFCSCMIQSKYVTEKTDQKKALLTLVSDLLYHQNRGKANVKISNMLDDDERQAWDGLKDNFISDQRPCLRIYVHTTDNKSAKSGMVAADQTSPAPLQTGKKNDQWLIVLNNKHLPDAVSDNVVTIVRALKKRRTL